MWSRILPFPPETLWTLNAFLALRPPSKGERNVSGLNGPAIDIYMTTGHEWIAGKGMTGVYKGSAVIDVDYDREWVSSSKDE